MTPETTATFIGLFNISIRQWVIDTLHIRNIECQEESVHLEGVLTLPGLAALQRLRLIIQISLLGSYMRKVPEVQEDSIFATLR